MKIQETFHEFFVFTRGETAQQGNSKPYKCFESVEKLSNVSSNLGRWKKLHKIQTKIVFFFFPVNKVNLKLTISEVNKINHFIAVSVTMFRRMFVPGSPLLAAAVIAKSEESADGKKEKNLVCKPSELPIYTSLVDRWLSLNQGYLFALSYRIDFAVTSKLNPNINLRNSRRQSRKESKAFVRS